MTFKVKDGIMVNGMQVIDNAGQMDFSKLKNRPTTLSGYGITDALSGLASADVASALGYTPVQSVAGRTGIVVLTKADVGLSNVDNTSDANKPVSSATQTALNAKEGAIAAGTAAQYFRGDKTWATHDKASVGLGNVDNTSDANKPVSSATQTALNAKLDASKVGAVNGVASLDATGKVPAAQLPSYVDDVLEYANLAAFPATGSSGLIYVALDTNKIYRWSGTTYVSIAASPGSTDAVPEGSVNLYFTNARATAAAPVQSVAGKTGAVTLTSADVGLGNVNNTSDMNKPVSTATQTALNGKEGIIAAGTTAQYYRGDKTWAAMPTALSQFSNDSGFITSAASIAGNAATATKLATARTINGVSFDGSADITVGAAWANITGRPTNVSSFTNDSGYITAAGSITGNAATATKTTGAVTGTDAADLVYGNMADNDQFRIRIGGNASNAGWVEIATADDGTEPIYVRQYTGVFTTLARTATLLDGSGNTSFPGTVTASAFSGNASSATKLATARTINGVSFDGTADITITAAASPQFNTTIIANSPNNLKIQLSDGGAARGWISADAGNPFRVINASNTAYVASVDNNGYLTTAAGITAGGAFTNWINEGASFNAPSGGMSPTTYNTVLTGGNDTGNKLVIFVNGSQRTADNLQNDVTIRNDGGRLVLGNGNETFFPGPVRVAGKFYANDWFRSNGSSGWYNETYAGGIFMQDNTYVRVYNNKQFLVQNRLRIEDGGTSSNYIEMWDSSWGQRYIHHNDGSMGFLNSGGGWAFMNDNGGTGYFPGNVVAYWSDRRLKKNIDNVEKSRDVGSIIDGFRVVQYDWDEEALQRNGIGIEAKTAQIGLIAQEAKANFADAVEINKSAKPTKMEEENGVERSGEITEEDPLLTINWDAITPLLLKEVQELRKRMTAVEEENASLRNRVSELEMKGV